MQAVQECRDEHGPHDELAAREEHNAVVSFVAEQRSTATADVQQRCCQQLHTTLQPSQQLTSRHQPGHLFLGLLTGTFVYDAAEAYRQAQPASQAAAAAAPLCCWHPATKLLSRTAFRNLRAQINTVDDNRTLQRMVIDTLVLSRPIRDDYSSTMATGGFELE
jgi:hypothetical protein